MQIKGSGNISRPPRSVICLIHQLGQEILQLKNSVTELFQISMRSFCVHFHTSACIQTFCKKNTIIFCLTLALLVPMIVLLHVKYNICEGKIGKIIANKRPNNLLSRTAISSKQNGLVGQTKRESKSYRVFRKNCVFSQFNATPPSPTFL